jgi:hypothetical protein
VVLSREFISIGLAQTSRVGPSLGVSAAFDQNCYLDLRHLRVAPWCPLADIVWCKLALILGEMAEFVAELASSTCRHLPEG